MAVAWAYLNITRPVCAWATYRGFLVPVDPNQGFVSVWTSGILREGRRDAFVAEFALEKVRQASFPDRVSRLEGMYVFPDLTSANRALSWPGETFSPRYLSELGIRELEGPGAWVDANWITHAYGNSAAPKQWEQRYWSGEPYPDGEPIWEVLLSQKATIFNTALRERAYQIIKQYLPDALAILEIGRLAAATGSDLGNIACHVRIDDGSLIGEHLLDMRDADSPVLHERLVALLKGGHPKRDEALSVGADQGVFYLPDLRRLDFCISLQEMGLSADK